MRARKIKGIHPPENKNTAGSPVQALPVPVCVEIPMSMHSGKPATPVVKVKDKVKVGQLIGELNGRISSPVHSSVSGTVKAINERDSITGRPAVSIVIETDGKQTPYEGLQPLALTSLEEFYDAVRDSGAVGLGGAGFPAAPKLAIKNLDELDYILINGAECEPYVTADTHTMMYDTRYIIAGIDLLLKFMKPKRGVIICIEDNKPEAIEAMRRACEGHGLVKVRALPTSYPQGERKVLVYNVTGRIVPEGARLADAGVIVNNCTTIAVIGKYVKTGMPLVEKVVTVDGPAVREPKNVLAPIGTPIRELFEFCGGFIDGPRTGASGTRSRVPDTGDSGGPDGTGGGENILPAKILSGGPMMGVALPGLDMPVVKTTNSLLAFPPGFAGTGTAGAAGGASAAKTAGGARVAEGVAETVCIKCGRCLSVCPMNLMPPNIEQTFLKISSGGETSKYLDKLNHYKVNMCVECGSCAYVCPAKRPLVQAIQVSKTMLWKSGQKSKA